MNHYDMLKGDMGKWRTLSIAAIVTVGLMAYANTFVAPMVFDDLIIIEDNPYTKDIRYFLHPFEAMSAPARESLKLGFKTRFVSFLSFAANYAIHGPDVRGYHALNLALHIANALMVYALVLITARLAGFNNKRRSADPEALALICALVFVSHPVQTMAVTYITQRYTLLAAFFYLSSLLCYIGHRMAGDRAGRIAFYTASLVLLALGAQSKEITFTLPFAIALYDLMFFDGRPARLARILPHLAIGLSIPIILLSQSGGTDSAGVIDAATKVASARFIGRWDYLITESRVIVTYLRLALLPIGQCLDYDYPILRSIGPAVIISGSAILGSISLGFAMWRRGRDPHARLTAFGILWFFLALSLESSFVPLIDVIDEYRLYLPMVGFAMAAGSIIMHSTAGMDAAARSIVKTLGIIVLMSLVSLTWARNALWQSQVSLWADTVAKAPANPRAQTNLGTAYLRAGEPDKALRHYRLASELNPDFPMLSMNIASAYEKLGMPDMARHYYDVALMQYPGNSESLYNMAVVELEAGNQDRAEGLLRSALKANRHMPQAHNNLGNIAMGRGDKETAKAEYQAAMAADPSYGEAHYNMGTALMAEGRLEEAIQFYRQALSRKPDYADAANNLGNALMRMRDFRGAAEAFRDAARMRPDFAPALYNLGVALEASGDKGKAVEAYRNALKSDPAFAPAREKLKQ